MIKGVIYFNRNLGCLTRIAVSLHSLRKHYSGPVAILDDGAVLDDSKQKWFIELVGKMGATVQRVEKGHKHILVRKSGIWREMPFDCSMFLDADTLILASVDQFLAWIEEHDCVVSCFNNWRTARGRVARRIRDWEKVDPLLIEPALKYGWAINTGIMGFKRGAAILPEYERLTEIGYRAGCRRKVLDETAMQLLLPKFKHYLAPAEYNISGMHGDWRAAKIIHFHGHKHCRSNDNCLLWKKEFLDVLKDFPEFTKHLESPSEDKTVDLWRRNIIKRRRDITIVSAVNPAYAERARRNVDLWMRTPGLREQNFIIFVNGFRGPEERKFLDFPNIKAIRWNYEHADGNPRELMLAAFVLGVAEHIKTDFWMKLDIDTRPIQSWWDWPEFENFTITSHRWGFTKMKSDEKATEHWFHRLDKLFSPDKPFFTRQYDPVKDFRVRHNRNGLPMRFGSFAHIERTSFTRRIAEVIREKNGGRLPIPSQDTLSWYCACLWKEPVKLVNQRLWFSPR